MEIKVAELYEKLSKNDSAFVKEFEKIVNKNITLFEVDENTNELTKVDNYLPISVFVEDDEIGFDFGKEDYQRVYLNNTDIIQIIE